MTLNTKSIRWAFNVTSWNPTQAQICLATRCIQQEEKDRIRKFVFGNNFKSSLIGRLMLRKFVHDTTGIPYEDIKFTRDQKGKPFLANAITNLEIDVNVSHQGDFAVLAGELGSTKIGIDVMKMEYTTRNRSLTDFFRLMHRHFSQKEWDNIKYDSSEQKQTAAFYRHWCLKESYVKNLGCGITIDLQKISFEIRKRVLSKIEVVSDTVCVVDGEKLVDWRFEESLLDDDHCVAVSVFKPQGIEPVKFEVMDFEELLKNAKPLLEEDLDLCMEFFRKEDCPKISI